MGVFSIEGLVNNGCLKWLTKRGEGDREEKKCGGREGVSEGRGRGRVGEMIKGLGQRREGEVERGKEGKEGAEVGDEGGERKRDRREGENGVGGWGRDHSQ